MVDQGITLTLRTADRYAVIPGNDGATAVAFQVDGQWTGALFDGADLGALASRIVQRAAEVARECAPQSATDATLATPPTPAHSLAVTSIGVEAGRNRSEAILVLCVGSFTLRFTLEPSTFVEISLDLLSMMDRATPAKTMN